MRLGFNHNVRYKGEVYHVQTEDSGVNAPHVITLLYRGGVILASKKSTYHDILSFDNRDELVDELMKSQHKGMLRALKNGEFDQVIAQRFGGGGEVAPHPPTPAGSPHPVDLFGGGDASGADGGVDDIDDLITLLELEVQEQKRETKSIDDAVLDFFSLR